jgi:hypothetical protein
MAGFAAGSPKTFPGKNYRLKGKATKFDLWFVASAQ